MAFERITIAVRAAKAPAGITITQHGKTVIAVHKDLIAEVCFDKQMKFAVLLGRDEDAGKLRIIQDRNGVACARELQRTGAFFFNLGIVPALGTTPQKQRPAKARCVDDGIEIELPEDDGPKLLPAPAKEPEAESASNSTRKVYVAGTTIINGISINTRPDEERIVFKGKDLIVSEREAKFLELLARPRPTPVAMSFLVGRLWEGKPPATAETMVSQMANELKKSLAPIGLALNHIKGVGYQLKDL